MGESSSAAKRTVFLVGAGLVEAESTESVVLIEEAFLVAAFGRATFLRTLRSRSY
jgi:hypothetical protein